MNLVTIDESGLVLIPQQVREQLGINPPAQLSLEIQAGPIILAPIPKEPEIECASGVSDVLTKPGVRSATLNSKKPLLTMENQAFSGPECRLLVRARLNTDWNYRIKPRA